MADQTTVLAHFYRAAVMHADVWRRRLDATTNWAIVTTAAVITFAFGDAQAPHFVLLMAMVFTLFFLLMESRRYQIYHVWELRIQTLHHYLIVPALLHLEDPDPDEVHTAFAQLARDLGITTPRMPLWRAAGYRMRRNYGPIFTIILLAWLLKLGLMPQPAADVVQLVERAAIGPVPGVWVVAFFGLFFAVCIVLAATAPSEHIVDWTMQEAPLKRMIRSGEAMAREMGSGRRSKHGGGGPSEGSEPGD